MANPCVDVAIDVSSSSDGWGEWQMPGELFAYSTARSEAEEALNHLSGAIARLGHYADDLRRDVRTAASIPNGLPSPQEILTAYRAWETAKAKVQVAFNALPPDQRDGQLSPDDIAGTRRFTISSALKA